MDWKKLFGLKPRGPRGPRFEGVEVQEWAGDVVEAWLEGDLTHPREEEWLADRRRRNVWAVVVLRPNRRGDDKVVVHVDGHIIGEVPAARLKREEPLRAALGSGVNVGVVRVSADERPVLFLGAGYKYRPRAPWET